MKLFLLLISIGVLTSTLTQSQTLPQTYALSLKEYETKRYNEAILLLKRVTFFDPRYKTDSVNILLAKSYFSLRQYDKSLYHFTRCGKDFCLERSQCYFLTKQFDAALVELNSYEPDSTTINSFYFLKTCIALQLDELDSAVIYARKLRATNDSLSHEVDSVVEIYKELRSRLLLFPTLASAVVPGMGLAMMGHHLQGINAFVLNAVFATTVVLIGLSISFLDAGIIVGPWFVRYYIGQIAKIRKQHELDCQELRYSVVSKCKMLVSSKR